MHRQNPSSYDDKSWEMLLCRSSSSAWDFLLTMCLILLIYLRLPAQREARDKQSKRKEEKGGEYQIGFQYRTGELAGKDE